MIPGSYQIPNRYQLAAALNRVTDRIVNPGSGNIGNSCTISNKKILRPITTIQLMTIRSRTWGDNSRIYGFCTPGDYLVCRAGRYRAIDGKHEFGEDQHNVSVSFVDDTRSSQFTFETETPDRNFFEFNIGVAIMFTHGAQLFMNYRTLLGYSLL